MRPEKIEFETGMPIRAFVRSFEQYPYHWHNTMEIMQVLKGSVNISLGNDDLLLRENDIAIVNIGEMHRITKTESENKILFIHIDGSFCQRILPDNGYFFIYCCSAYYEAETPEKYKVLKDYIWQLTQALLENNQRNHYVNLENILAAMLRYLLYNFDFLRWGYGTIPFDDRRVERLSKIAEHCSSNLEIKLGLKALAAEVGVSVQHLSHDIKEKFGFTFQELLYYSKCEHASKLLLSTDARIVDIAMQCGFSDVKYLIKHFKKCFQSTPSGFRKEYRADNECLASLAQYRDYPLSTVVSIQK